MSPSYMPKRSRRRAKSPILIIDSDEPEPDYAQLLEVLDRPCNCSACSGGVTVRTPNPKYL